MHLLSYRATGNLGDAIQTVALEQLLGGCSGYVNRDAPSAAGLPLLINGWLGDRWQAGDGASIYAGIHLATPRALQRLVALRPTLIGARDPATAEALAAHSIEAPVIGCATLTLPRYTGPRSGILAIDYPAANTPPEAESLTHWISPRLPWPAQLAAARAALQRYRTAKAVFTTRLHVILPCLAFGTPVTYPANADPRFSILQSIGLPQAGEGMIEQDPLFSTTYNAFLSAAVEHVLRTRHYNQLQNELLPFHSKRG